MDYYDGIDPRRWDSIDQFMGHLVTVAIDGRDAAWGILEYLTPDGWGGVRETSGLLYEWRREWMRPDVT